MCMCMCMCMCVCFCLTCSEVYLDNAGSAMASTSGTWKKKDRERRNQNMSPCPCVFGLLRIGCSTMFFYKLIQRKQSVLYRVVFRCDNSLCPCPAQTVMRRIFGCCTPPLLSSLFWRKASVLRPPVLRFSRDAR